MKDEKTLIEQIPAEPKPEKISERELRTEKEVAALFHRSTVSVWRARKEGLLTYRRMMGKVLFRYTDLLQFLETSKRGG